MLAQDRIQREIYEAREKARRDAEDWKSALQRAEERVRNSYTEGCAQGHEVGRAEGRAEGQLVGELIGQIRLCEALLHRPPRPESELQQMSPEALQELAASLRAEVLNNR